MRAKLVHESDGQRTFVVVLEAGDEVMSCLRSFAEQQKLSAAQLTGIGAFSDAVLAYFDWESKSYAKIPVGEQVEVASMLGDVALDSEETWRCTFIWCLGAVTGGRWRAIWTRRMCARRWKSW